MGWLRPLLFKREGAAVDAERRSGEPAPLECPSTVTTTVNVREWLCNPVHSLSEATHMRGSAFLQTIALGGWTFV